jgi:hypothetical protein
LQQTCIYPYITANGNIKIGFVSDFSHCKKSIEKKKANQNEHQPNQQNEPKTINSKETT